LFSNRGEKRRVEKQNQDVLHSELCKKVIQKNMIKKEDGSIQSHCFLTCNSNGNMNIAEDNFFVINQFPNCYVFYSKNEQNNQECYNIYSKGISRNAIYNLILTEIELNEGTIKNWNRFVENKLKHLKDITSWLEYWYWYKSYYSILHIQSISVYQLYIGSF
jgi:hypothetical protein